MSGNQNKSLPWNTTVCERGTSRGTIVPLFMHYWKILLNVYFLSNFNIYQSYFVTDSLLILLVLSILQK